MGYEGKHSSSMSLYLILRESAYEIYSSKPVTPTKFLRYFSIKFLIAAISVCVTRPLDKSV